MSRLSPILFLVGVSVVVGTVMTVSNRADQQTSAPSELQPPTVAASRADEAAQPVHADSPKKASALQIAWETDFESAIKKAREQNKPVLIDFYTDWCTVCKKLDRETLAHSSVIDASREWVAVKVNAEKRPDIAGAYGVTGYPTIVWARPTGQPLDKLEGFASPAEFAQMTQAARKSFG